jgi:Ca-activated chloride channel family protein
MPRRDTTHLQNSRIFRVALLFSLLIPIAAGQSSTPAGEAFPSGIAVPAAKQDPAKDPAKQDPAPQEPSKQTPQQAPAQTPAAPAQPSSGGQEDEGGFKFHTSVEEVVLHATVVDDKQRMVTNLEKPAFSVFEDGKPQNIVSFRHEDIPVALGIVIDNSGSMREKRDKVNKAAINLVKASNPQDEVFIVNFNDEYYLDQDFTADIGKMKEALEKVDTRGGTALYDAVVASAGHLKKNAKLEKRVLLVVTDGEDNESQETLEQAIRRLQEENGPTVYAIGLLGEEKARRARKALQFIAEKTGGLAFFPKSLDEVDSITRNVAHDIRNQYTLGYKPTNPKSSGGYRTIRVDAKSKGYGKLTVRTKSGYYAGQDRAATDANLPKQSGAPK